MRLVIVESPYAAPTPEGIERNVAYARAALADCLGRGEAPYASHLLYTQPGVLRDEVPEQRRLGIEVGLAWCDVAMLAMDGAWRSAGADGAAFVAMLEEKHAINIVRVWRRGADGTIEHVREEVAVLEDDGDPA